MTTTIKPSLRSTPDDAPEHRAAVIMRRNVIETMAREDAEEHHANPAYAEQSAIERLSSLERFRGEALDSLQIPDEDSSDAIRIYTDAWSATWARLTSPTPAPRPGTAYDLKKARVREQLVMLVTRAWIAGQNAVLDSVADDTPAIGVKPRTAEEAAPLMVEGALDAIMQVLA